jgi:hypothetical protein
LAALLKPRTKAEYSGMATLRRSDVRQVHVTIPDGVEFADLHLARDVNNGLVRFNIAPIEAICEASTLDLAEIVEGPQPLVGLLIAAWYRAHVEQGGALDPVQEDLLEEAQLEMEHGGGFAYPPGHA